MNITRNRSVAGSVGYRAEPYHRAPSRARLRPQSARVAAAQAKVASGTHSAGQAAIGIVRVVTPIATDDPTFVAPKTLKRTYASSFRIGQQDEARPAAA